MLKTKLLPVALLVAASAAGMSAARAAQPVAEAMTLPSSVWFDGYCDGITNIVKISRKTYSGTYDALTNCGQFTAQAGGPSGNRMYGAGFTTSGAAFTAETYPYYGVSYVFIVNTDGTWGITDTYGDLVNSGTWTSGAAAHQVGTRSAITGR